MSIVINQAARCGKPGTRGLCKLKLRGGLCPVHDNLEAARERLRAMGKRGGQTRATQFDSEFQQNARSHVKRESLQRAGRAGYAQVGGEVWRCEQSEKARQWRLAHPSEPERWVIEILMEHLSLTVSYDREYVIEGDERAVDFAMPDERCVIEVVGHQYKASFGETAPRAGKFADKIAWLASLGYHVHVVDASPGADRNVEKTRLLAFLSQHRLLD